MTRPSNPGDYIGTHLETIARLHAELVSFLAVLNALPVSPDSRTLLSIAERSSLLRRIAGETEREGVVHLAQDISDLAHQMETVEVEQRIALLQTLRRRSDSFARSLADLLRV